MIDGGRGVIVEAVLVDKLPLEVSGQLATDVRPVDVGHDAHGGLNDEDDRQEDGVVQDLLVGAAAEADAAEKRREHDNST